MDCSRQVTIMHLGFPLFKDYRNKNLHLSKEEFQGFIHPEYAPHMYGIMMSETMGDLDKVRTTK